jgi:two-component system NarL family sensor kinase
MHDQKISSKYIILLTGLLLFIFLLIFFLNIVKYHKKNIKLYAEKLKAEINGREHERHRISKDLHDELGANLSATKMLLQAVSHIPEDQQKLIELAKKNLDETIESMRNITSDLFPTAIEAYGLVICVEDLVNKINFIGKIQIYLNNEVEDIESMFSSEHKIHLFRIIKEIIQNAIKHSRSSKLYINIISMKDGILLNTIDEGLGFDASNYDYLKRGNGMQNIFNRIDVLKGSMEIETSYGSGVTYLIEIPKTNAKFKN